MRDEQRVRERLERLPPQQREHRAARERDVVEPERHDEYEREALVLLDHMLKEHCQVVVENRGNAQRDDDNRETAEKLGCVREVPQRAQVAALAGVARDDRDLRREREHEARLRDVIQVAQHAVALARERHEARKAHKGAHVQ